MLASNTPLERTTRANPLRRSIVRREIPNITVAREEWIVRKEFLDEDDEEHEDEDKEPRRMRTRTRLSNESGFARHRCSTLRLGSEDALFFGVATKERAAVVQAHERTWANSRAASVVWYTDAPLPGVRCVHHAPADHDMLRRRMKVLLHTHKWYGNLFQWYVAVEDDAYVFVQPLLAQLEKLDPQENVVVGRVHNWTDTIGPRPPHPCPTRGQKFPFVNAGSGVVYSRASLATLANAILDARCPQSFYAYHDPNATSRQTHPYMVDVVVSRCSSALGARLVSLCGFNNMLPAAAGVDADGLACGSQRAANTGQVCALLTFNLLKTPTLVEELHAAASRSCMLQIEPAKPNHKGRAGDRGGADRADLSVFALVVIVAVAVAVLLLLLLRLP